MVTSVARSKKFKVTIFAKFVPVATVPNHEVRAVDVTVAWAGVRLDPVVLPPVEPPALPPVVLEAFFVPMDEVDLLVQELRAASDATV